MLTFSSLCEKSSHEAIYAVPVTLETEDLPMWFRKTEISHGFLCYSPTPFLLSSMRCNKYHSTLLRSHLFGKLFPSLSKSQPPAPFHTAYPLPYSTSLNGFGSPLAYCMFSFCLFLSMITNSVRAGIFFLIAGYLFFLGWY